MERGVEGVEGVESVESWEVGESGEYGESGESVMCGEGGGWTGQILPQFTKVIPPVLVSREGLRH